MALGRLRVCIKLWDCWHRLSWVTSGIVGAPAYSQQHNLAALSRTSSKNPINPSTHIPARWVSFGAHSGSKIACSFSPLTSKGIELWQLTYILTTRLRRSYIQHSIIIIHLSLRQSLLKQYIKLDPRCWSSVFASAMNVADSPLPPPSGVSLDATLGALQIGVSMVVFLFGILTLQMYYYYEHHSGDGPFVKGFVSAVSSTNIYNSTYSDGIDLVLGASTFYRLASPELSLDRYKLRIVQISQRKFMVSWRCYHTL